MRQPSVTHTSSASAASGTYDYDLLVIGGGSGGLACAKEAAKLGANVCLCDFVKPSPQGTRWGLGGTCVNVGCIPKKLMHRSATMREEAKDLPFFGWGVDTPAAGDSGEPRGPELALQWTKLVSNVQDHIASLNYGYKGDLRDNSVTYRNALAKLTADPHKVELRNKQGKVDTVSAARIVVAVGGRPRALQCDGRELAISSDDIFSMEKSPGEVLIVGAGYIALETAGFLVGLGFSVTLMVRSILLRGFDRECVVMIEKDLVKRGVKILARCTPVKIEAAASAADAGDAASAASTGGADASPATARKTVTWRNESGTEESAEFDTVFAAIGREPDTSSLGIDTAGLETSRSGKIVCTDEQTSVPNVFAIGDVVEGKPELTPVAIQAGRLLARRLYGGSDRGFDYRCVATTVFTPLEYGTIGLSEEAAAEEHGADSIDAYLSKYKPLEWTLNYYRHEEFSFAKVVVDLRTDRIIGLHYLGPNAGEVTQGFAAAMRMGLTLTALRDTIGIHPTTAEEFTSLEVSRSSGAPIEKGSC
jgi:thioredoxin reductase (NADPH)